MASAVISFRSVRLAAVAAAAALGFAAVNASAAHATTFDFCGTSSNPVLLSGTNNRCADSTYHRFNYVRSYAYMSTYNTCAIVKEYSDGTGHNDTAPACGFTNNYVESDCSVPYSCTGYGTITNGTNGNSAELWGFASI